MDGSSGNRAIIIAAGLGLLLFLLGMALGVASGMALILAVLAGVGAWFLLRAREQDGSRGSGAGASRPASGTLQALGPDDVVGLDGRTWVVRGTVRFDEDGFTWDEHLIADGDSKRWLSVEDDEGDLEVVLWERSATTELEPGGELIEHGGVSYRLDERGSARYRSEGSPGMPASGQMSYADYQAGTRRLSFERYTTDGGWELCVGDVVIPHAIEVYPSSAAATAGR